MGALGINIYIGIIRYNLYPMIPVGITPPPPIPVSYIYTTSTFDFFQLYFPRARTVFVPKKNLTITWCLLLWRKWAGLLWKTNKFGISKNCAKKTARVSSLCSLTLNKKTQPTANDTLLYKMSAQVRQGEIKKRYIGNIANWELKKCYERKQSFWTSRTIYDW